MVTPLLQIVPTLQAAGLAAHNVNKVTKKDLKTKDILALGVTNIVGVSLIGETGKLVGSI